MTHKSDEKKTLLQSVKSELTSRTAESWAFLVVVGCSQCLFLILYFIFLDYQHFSPGDTIDAGQSVSNYYKSYLDVTAMVFVGFGFLMTFLKKYGYSAFGLNFLIAAIAFQWSILCVGFFHSLQHNFKEKLYMNVVWLIEGNFGAAAVLISFGAVIGKVSPTQLVVMTMIEVVFYALNLYIGNKVMKAIDMGGSMFIHTFGAYFGIAVSSIVSQKAVRKSELHKNQGAKYNSDMFSLIGTIWLWMLWPSFNGALSPKEGQFRVIVNTVTSLLGCVVTTFFMTKLYHGKFEMEDIQNASVAGGVAVGSSSDLVIAPGGALAIGMVAAIVSCTGYRYGSKLLRKFYIHDTCGVNNLHGMPGILGGLSGSITSAIAVRKKNLYGSDYTNIFTHGPNQWGYQLLALVTTLGIATVSGLGTGLLLRWLTPPKYLFQDSEYWAVPQEEYIPDDEESVGLIPAHAKDNKLNIELDETKQQQQAAQQQQQQAQLQPQQEQQPQQTQPQPQQQTQQPQTNVDNNSANANNNNVVDNNTIDVQV